MNDYQQNKNPDWSYFVGMYSTRLRQVFSIKNYEKQEHALKVFDFDEFPNKNIDNGSVCTVYSAVSSWVAESWYLFAMAPRCDLHTHKSTTRVK